MKWARTELFKKLLVRDSTLPMNLKSVIQDTGYRIHSIGYRTQEDSNNFFKSSFMCSIIPQPCMFLGPPMDNALPHYTVQWCAVMCSSPLCLEVPEVRLLMAGWSVLSLTTAVQQSTLQCTVHYSEVLSKSLGKNLLHPHLGFDWEKTKPLGIPPKFTTIKICLFGTFYNFLVFFCFVATKMFSVQL